MDRVRSLHRRLGIVILAMAFVTAACGDNGTPLGEGTTGGGVTTTGEDGTTTGGDATSVAPPAPEDVEGTLTMWRIAGEADWWTGFIDRFHTAYPNASIDLTSYTTEEYWTKLVAAFSAGDPPDIHTNANGEDVWKYSRTGNLVAVNELVDLSAWSPASVGLFTASDGNAYAVPLYTFLIPVWYNKDLFEENEVTVPTTWDELLAACDTLSAAGVIPIALGNGGADQWTAQFFLESLMYQYGGPSVHVDATFGNNDAAWTDPELVDSARRVTELVDHDCFPNGFTGLSYDQMTALFYSGKAAMVHQGNWILPEVEKAGFAGDVFGFPDVPDGAHSTANLEGMLAGAEGVMVSSKAAKENPNLAKAFLYQLSQELDKYANENGALSVAAEPHPEGGDLQLRFAELLQSVGEYMSATNSVVPSSIHAAFFQNLYDLTAGSLTPEEWGQAMQDAVEKERDNFPPPA